MLVVWPKWCVHPVSAIRARVLGTRSVVSVFGWIVERAMACFWSYVVEALVLFVLCVGGPLFSLKLEILVVLFFNCGNGSPLFQFWEAPVRSETVVLSVAMVALLACGLSGRVQIARSPLRR